MKLKDIYSLAVTRGLETDPRGLDGVSRLLRMEKERFKALSEEERLDYDLEKLSSPYHDTRILYGDPDLLVKKVLAGIDVEAGEIVLADLLRSRGNGVDLVIAHHPEGKALANLHLVMHAQEDLMHQHGVPIHIAEGVMAPRIEEVRRGLAPGNHNRAVDAASLLEVPLMCVHSAADNHAATYIQSLMDDKKPETLKDILSLLKEIPEYRAAAANSAVTPSIVVGSEKRRAGKVLVMMAGGTSGPEQIYEKLARAGIGTVLVMHLPEKNRKEAKRNHVNVIVAGHMASDSLGMNLFLDELEKNGLEITTCSGLFRHSRVQATG